MAKAKNVLGFELEACGTSPATGFYRDGCCRTGPEDEGLHVICAEMTGEFLEYALQQGNDLVTPNPMFDFPGLVPGSRWCLCATRWKQAWQANVAPPVILAATHISALEFVDLEVLRAHAIDTPEE